MMQPFVIHAFSAEPVPALSKGRYYTGGGGLLPTVIPLAQACRVERLDMTVKEFLGFDIPGAFVERQADGSIAVIRPNQKPSKYAQYVEPKAKEGE